MPAIATARPPRRRDDDAHPAAILAIGRARHASTATTAPAARNGDFKPRGDRPNYRERGERKAAVTPRGDRDGRADRAFLGPKFGDRPDRRGTVSGEKRPYAPRGDRPNSSGDADPAARRRVASA